MTVFKNLKKNLFGAPDRAGREWATQRIALFERDHGYVPDLDRPATFSEKLLRRILDRRDPYYPLYASKLAVKYFLAAHNIAGLHLPERIAVRAQLCPQDFDAFPEAFVIKSSFGSGLNRIVRDKSTEDRVELCAFFNDRLPSMRNARGQTDPSNCIIVEELLTQPDGAIPMDLKFHCFHDPDGGFRHILQLDTDRLGAHEQSFVDEEYNPLPMQFSDRPAHRTLPPPPDQLADAVRIARAASQGFDYIRVDLYNVRGRIYFGEFTPFHQGGRGRMTPAEWDRRLGDMWHFREPSYRSAI